MHVAPQRVVQYAPATVTWQPTDQDGELIAASGVPTVTVVRSDGTELTGLTPAITAGVVELELDADTLSSLDILTVTWELDGDTRGITKLDVVAPGGVTVAEVRATESSLADQARYPSSKVRAALDVVEAMVESVTHTAFTPRLSVAHFYGKGAYVHVLPTLALRRVRWAYTTVDNIRTDAETIDLDEVVANEAGILVGYWWWKGANVTVGYEHGWDAPPADLRSAICAAVRRRLNTPTAGIDPRAMSYQPPEGGNVVLATPGLGPWVTGIPEIDEVLVRYSSKMPKVG
jgi:hypothetical protein